MDDGSYPSTPTGRRSRTASDSESDLALAQQHPAYSLRRGSCPAAPTVSELALSLLRKGRTPEKLNELWKTFQQLNTNQIGIQDETKSESELEENKDRNGNKKTKKKKKSSIQNRIPSFDQNDRCANRFKIEENTQIHWIDQEKFYVEFPPIPIDSDNENGIKTMENKENENKPGKSKRSVRFSQAPLKVYSTFGPDEYDRHVTVVDAFVAFSIFELERRLEKMHIFEIELHKGPNQRLGFDIVGMGVNADRGSDTLSIFITAISAGGAAARDGRIQKWDQIVQVDGDRLIGVSQQYAAQVLRSTTGVVKLKMARHQDPDNSEIAILCKNNNH